MRTLKKYLKKLSPLWLLHSYHYLLAFSGTLFYGFPSKKMVVIGITGTKGKTSTANFVHAVLTAGGHKTGIITTANIKIGTEELPNTYHMTMPGRFTIHRLMRRMVQAGCTHCVVETTSEGIKQYRHIGIAYDYVIFTNLTPEHLASHGGSFEKYKQTKGILFKTVSTRKPKTIHGKDIPRTIIANSDSEHATYYLSFPADKKITYSVHKPSDVQAHNISDTASGIRFDVGNSNFASPVLGSFNVENILPAIIVGREEGMSDSEIAQGLTTLETIPGRMEQIEAGQNFTLIVDYAHEKESMTRVLTTARALVGLDHRVIILLGAEGGGRDKTKRAIMGTLAGQLADYCIVSNVDPYDDDPQEILEGITKASETTGKVRNTDLFVIEDRREGIAKALTLAQAGDIVLITGKGAEQSMILGSTTIPWDDRRVVREELEKILTSR